MALPLLHIFISKLSHVNSRTKLRPSRTIYDPLLLTYRDLNSEILPSHLRIQSYSDRELDIQTITQCPMQHSPGVLGISRSDNPKVTHKAKK